MKDETNRTYGDKKTEQGIPVDSGNPTNQIFDFRRRWRRRRVVEEEARQLPDEVDGDGLRRGDRVDAEVVEDVPLAHLRKRLKIFSF